MKVTSRQRTGRITYVANSGISYVALFGQVSIIIASLYFYFSSYQINAWCSAGLASLAFLIRCEPTEEALILHNLGLQTSTYGTLRYFSDTHQFYPKHEIKAFLINEVFEGIQVNYVIQIVKKDCDKISLVFPTKRPKLMDLTKIWKSLNDI